MNIPPATSCTGLPPAGPGPSHAAGHSAQYDASATQADSPTLVKARASTPHRRGVRDVCRATRTVANRCVAVVRGAQGRLSRKVDRATVRMEQACMDTAVRAMHTMRPVLKRVPALGSAGSAAEKARAQTKQRLDTDIADVRRYKKTFKKGLPRIKAAEQKFERMHAAALRCRKDARDHLEKHSTRLCQALPALALGQARQAQGAGPNVLQAAIQKGREAVRLGADPTPDDAAKSVDRLWAYAREEALAASIDRAVQALQASAARRPALEEAIGACRTLVERGQALRRECAVDFSAWDEALRACANDHVEPCLVMLEQKHKVDGLPHPGKPDWMATLAGKLDVAEPSSADVRRYIKAHAGRSLRALSDSAFDDMYRTVAPGGYMGTIAARTDRLRSADVLDAWRDAADEERVRRYETEPLHALADVTRLIEDRALQGMSDRGADASQVALPQQPGFYGQARDAVHALLRGLCLSMRNDEGRAAYLSKLIFERAAEADRVQLLQNTAWRDPAVFARFMDGVLRVTNNADIIGPQYTRLLQEVQVIVQGTALAAGDARAQAGWRNPSDFDGLDGALPRKARGALRKAWDKIAFWGGYLLVGNSVKLEAARFSYHQAHVEERLHRWIKEASRDKLRPAEMRRAFQDFLAVGDDLRTEFDNAGFRDTACDGYLRMAFSLAIARLGPKQLKSLYRNLQQACPDMRDRRAKLPVLSTLQAWWRNKFLDEDRVTPRDSVQWQRTAHRCWTGLRAAVEQEPEARGYAMQLARLASKFDRDSSKDYEGIKAALDGIIRVDGGTWARPDDGAFTAYDAGWARQDPGYMGRLIGRLARYEHRMDDFLKAEALTRTIVEENRFIYRYFQQGLLYSGRRFFDNNPMNRYASRFEDAAGLEDAEPDVPPPSAAGPSGAQPGAQASTASAQPLADSAQRSTPTAQPSTSMA